MSGKRTPVYSERRVHLGNNPCSLVASTEYDHGMGPPYMACWHTHYLYEAEHREHGRKFFLTLGGCGATWIRDEEVDAIKRRYSVPQQPRPAR